MLKKFILENRHLSGRLMKHLPNAHDVLNQYGEIVGKYMRAVPAARVVDVGGGRDCAFGHYKLRGAKICAVDISQDELAHNRIVDEKYVSDATRSIPLQSSSADIIASRAVIEHMCGVNRYVQEAYRVLKPEGVLITGFPNKWAPGALLNRWIPERLKRSILFRVVPDSPGKCGFPAYYEDCSISEFTQLLNRSGFEVTEVYRGYFQADYLAFFFPLFVVAALCDYLCWWWDLAPLCSASIICATKSGNPAKARLEPTETRVEVPAFVREARNAAGAGDHPQQMPVST